MAGKTKVRVIKAKDSKPKKTVKKSTKEKKAVKEKESAKIIAKLTAPITATGRYFKNSWYEVRQVRWPNRKTTWSMTVSVLIYTAIFLIIIVLLDMLFSSIFNRVLG